MLPVVNKPLIQYGVEEALAAGLTQIAMVTGRGKRSLEDHFDISYELEHQIRNTDKEKYLVGIRRLIDECSFSYTRQVEMKGLGHAILSGRPLIGDEPFAVVLADDLCINLDGDPVLAQMVKLYNQFRCSIVAIQEVPPEETSKYGVIAGEMIRDDIFRVSHMVEKPKPEDAPSNLAIIGRYILTPDIFELIEQTEPGKGGEIQITDALMKQARTVACWPTNSRDSVSTAVAPRVTSRRPTSATRTSTSPVRRSDQSGHLQVARSFYGAGNSSAPGPSGWP